MLSKIEFNHTWYIERFSTTTWRQVKGLRMLSEPRLVFSAGFIIYKNGVYVFSLVVIFIN